MITCAKIWTEIFRSYDFTGVRFFYWFVHRRSTRSANDWCWLVDLGDHFQHLLGDAELMFASSLKQRPPTHRPAGAAFITTICFVAVRCVIKNSVPDNRVCGLFCTCRSLITMYNIAKFDNSKTNKVINMQAKTC